MSKEKTEQYKKLIATKEINKIITQSLDFFGPIITLSLLSKMSDMIEEYKILNKIK